MRINLFAIAAVTLLTGASSVAAVPTPEALAASSNISAPSPMTAEQLADVSGGQAVTVNALNTQTLNAAVTGNQISAGSIQSGSVSFDKNTFAGFNGIGNFVINTGNNNVLQGSLSVTVVPLP